MWIQLQLLTEMPKTARKTAKKVVRKAKAVVDHVWSQIDIDYSLIELKTFKKSWFKRAIEWICKKICG